MDIPKSLSKCHSDQCRIRGVRASATAMYGLVYGHNKNEKIGGLESKKPPEGSCAELGGMAMVTQD